MLSFPSFLLHKLYMQIYNLQAGNISYSFSTCPKGSSSRILFAIYKIFSIGRALGKCRHKPRPFHLASSWSPALPWLKQPWCGFGVLICWAKAQLGNSAAACKAHTASALTSCPFGCARNPCTGSSVSFTAEPCHVLQQCCHWHHTKQETPSAGYLGHRTTEWFGVGRDFKDH